MIIIVNDGPETGQGPEGWHEYTVRIGKRGVARFRHRRRDGLARCLREAAKAVQADECWQQWMETNEQRKRSG